MKEVLAILAVVSLVLNGYLVYATYFQGGNGGNWQSSNEEGEGEILKDLSVIVPPNKLGDDAVFDYKVYAEMYWKDFETGNWSDYRLTVNGDMRYRYNANTVQKNDGYWNKHNTLDYESDTKGSLEIYVASNDAEPMTIMGSIDDVHHEYKDLTEKRAIETYTTGDVAIDKLPRVNVPLSYKGIMDSYIDPKRPVEVPLGDQIYGDGTQIKLHDNGTIVKSTFYSLYNFTLSTVYNWSADRAVMFKGHKTLHLNITSLMFGDFYNYNEQFWISQDSPFFIKHFSRSNQTWTDKNGTLFFIIEFTHTLQDKGYTPGTADIPWGTCTGHHWADRSPEAEFKQYNYMPGAGNGYSASSFDFKTDDADQYARQHSLGLQNYLAKYDQPGNGAVTTYASYNASRNPLDVNGKAGSYRWNLTYGHWPTDDEWKEAQQTHDRNFSYNIVLLKNVTKDLSKPLQNQYIETTEIEYDWGPRRDTAALPREALPTEGLTLAASENIMMKNPMVAQKVQGNNGKIDWGNFETTYGISLSGMGGQQNPGYQMLELMTGITMPSSDYAWSVQKGTVYQSGSTFTASVDVNTGMFIYAVDIQGTALFGLFG